MLCVQDMALVDRDLTKLQRLADLQQLHVQRSDPWLLSDAALMELSDSLPSLKTVTRDDQQLLTSPALVVASPAAAAAAVAAAMTGWQDSTAEASAGSSIHAVAQHFNWLLGGDSKAKPAAFAQQDAAATVRSGLAAAAGSSSSSSSNLAWPEGPAVLVASVRTSNPGPAVSSQKGTAVSAQLGSKASPRGLRRSSNDNSSNHRSAPSHQHLITFDERYRYSTAMLLQLRPAAFIAAGAESHIEAGAGTLKSNADNSQQALETLTDLVDLALIPEEIRACSTSAGSRWR